MANNSIVNVNNNKNNNDRDEEEEEEVASPNSSVQSRPSINSATYTRPRIQPHVVAAGAILPVGYPIFCPRGGVAETSGGGFQNPWEALHRQHVGQMTRDAGYFTQDDRQVDQHFFQEDEEEAEEEDCYLRSSQQPPTAQQQLPNGLCLDLEDDPPPYYDDLVDKQSPASGLPPQRPSPPPALMCSSPRIQLATLTNNKLSPLEQKQQPLLITPEHIRRPRGEYIPLNPDIDKAHPPRWPAAAAATSDRWIADPFNVSDEEAPPVTEEHLSPSHIFASMSDLHAAIGRRNGEPEDMIGGELCNRGNSVDQSEEDSVEEDNDEVGSVVDDELPDPGAALQENSGKPSPPSTMTRTSTSPTSIVSSPYGTYSPHVWTDLKKDQCGSCASIT